MDLFSLFFTLALLGSLFITFIHIYDRRTCLIMSVLVLAVTIIAILAVKFLLISPA